MAELAHRHITIDGVRLHYVAAGAGRPLVLIHGMGASWVTWRENIAPLAERYAVYALDLPAHGDSSIPPRDYGHRSLVQTTVGFVRELGLEGATIVGNSAGGLAGMLAAEASNGAVTGLVLVSTAGLTTDLPLALRLATLRGVGEVLWARSIPRDRVLLRAIFHDPRLIDDHLVEELARTRNRKGSKGAVLQVLRDGATLRGLNPELLLLPRLRRLHLPVLLVWGVQDRIIPVTQAYRAHEEIPWIELDVFDPCGHWPHMERAPEFNRAVVRFVDTRVGWAQAEAL